jgi:adenylyltransferase/sulfurtransferase
MEAIKLLAGIGPFPPGRLLTIDTLSNEVTCVAVRRDPGCPACGERPRIADPLSPEDYRNEGRCVA